MAYLHDPDISQTRKVLGYIISIFPSAMIIFSGTMKLLGVQQIQDVMASIGIGELTMFIGILEILCVVLYWIPKTSNLGFFLLCSYTGGIIVAELAMSAASGHLAFPIPGVAVAVLFYVGTMLRKPRLSGLNI